MISKLAASVGLFVVMLTVLFVFPWAAQGQGRNGIYEPKPGDVVSGIVVIEGTAEDPNFLRYELAFRREFGTGDDWIVFAQGEQPVVDGTLAIWDTTVGGETSPIFPDGRYRLRLRVVRSDFNYDEYHVTGIIITNNSLTPSPTSTITTTTGITATPLPDALMVATLQAGANILPSLTPFPSPTPPATPENPALGSGSSAADPVDQERGVFAQLADIETGSFGPAFWFGVRIVGLAFIALAIYLLLRGTVRWLLRRVRSL